MCLGASQGLNGTFFLPPELHRLCPVSSSCPPTSSALNKADHVKTGLLTGTTGVQPVPTHP